MEGEGGKRREEEEEEGGEGGVFVVSREDLSLYLSHTLVYSNVV